jgi:hypothetical protein
MKIKKVKKLQRRSFTCRKSIKTKIKKIDEKKEGKKKGNAGLLIRLQ